MKLRARFDCYYKQSSLSSIGLMKTSRAARVIVWGILGAYLVPGNLDQHALFGHLPSCSLDSFSLVRIERTINRDERPCWTSHRHLILSEKFSGDHLIGESGPYHNRQHSGSDFSEPVS